jgi:Zn-dependent protease/predicted transcriptional regulator
MNLRLIHSMKTSVQIGKIIGIPIRIHFTFLLILALFAWSFSASSVSLLGFVIGYGGLAIDLSLKILLGIFIAILLFVCVIIHELGHSYVTQRYGYKINGITLFIFGGVSQAEEIPHDPKMEFTIAVVGPAISIFLGIVLYGFYLLINTIPSSIFMQTVSITVGTLTFYNILLGLFNLIPAFPIDGGRVLRSVLATQMEYKKATKIASNVGKGFAVAMAIVGIFFNIWLVLIAVFVYIGASEEDKSLQISITLENFKVKDLMTPVIDSIPPTMTLQEFSDYMIAHKHLGYPVMENNHLLGMMSINELHKVEHQKQKNTVVKDVMRKDVLSIHPDEPASTAFKVMTRNNHERLIVQKDGEYLGIISWSDLQRAVEIQGA